MGTQIIPDDLFGMGYKLFLENRSHGDYRKYSKEYCSDDSFYVAVVIFSYGDLIVEMYGRLGGFSFNVRLVIKPGEKISLEELRALEAMVGISNEALNDK